MEIKLVNISGFRLCRATGEDEQKLVKVTGKVGKVDRKKKRLSQDRLAKDDILVMQGAEEAFFGVMCYLLKRRGGNHCRPDYTKSKQKKEGKSCQKY